MSSIKQRRNAKKQKRIKHEREIADRKLQKSAAAIDSMYLFSKRPIKGYSFKAENSERDPRRGEKVYPSVSVMARGTLIEHKNDLSEEMQEREHKAQEEINRKRKCLAPAYNKGAYQPVFSKEDAKHIGR
jgi:hypothetical protein